MNEQDPKHKPSVPKGVDWAAVHERLARAQQKMAARQQLSEAENARILQARARTLARPPQPVQTEATFEVIEFRLAGESYALELALAHEVLPLKELTPVPCTPSFVLGLINVRGRLLSVVDLRRFFGLPFTGISDLNKAILLRSGTMEFGILADRIVGVRVLPRSALHTPPLLADARADFLLGVTAEALIVLAAEKLLTDPRIVVREEV